ncbi:hypothetical protein [Paenibacillus sp. CH40]|uniref:hypothetical protein n=1 Tax=Paenibacillus sp. CH40 TaxID=2962045 RepID=UPI0020B67AB8|nr:hypothetical protein [Paenibacillus sp. CH40]MCP3794590.1 hypothetical protein [Paenibacillus sp. CH40]
MFGKLEAGGEQQKNAMIAKLATEYLVIQLCLLFGVSRGEYYAYLKRKDTDRDGKQRH